MSAPRFHAEMEEPVSKETLEHFSARARRVTPVASASRTLTNVLLNHARTTVAVHKDRREHLSARAEQDLPEVLARPTHRNVLLNRAKTTVHVANQFRECSFAIVPMDLLAYDVKRRSMHVSRNPVETEDSAIRLPEERITAPALTEPPVCNAKWI